MKKIAIIVMLFILILSLLSGCFKVPKNLIPKPSASQFGSSQNGSASDAESPAVQSSDDSGSEDSSGPVSLAPATNPSEGYSNYISAKSEAYDRVMTVSENSDALALTVGMSFLGVTMIDFSMITVTMLSDDLQASEMAMSFLGMKDAKITGNGNDYTITFTDQNGDSIKQTCTYDAGKDQMAATIYDSDGKMSVYFEYVNLGNAYVSQYYTASDDGFEVIKAYFDLGNVSAFGVASASAEPVSILGKSGMNADFVKNDESYVILADGKLSVFDKGTTTTN